MTKTTKTFKGAGYSELFHHVASSEYRKNVIYRTANGSLEFRNGRAYSRGELIGIVDFANQRILRKTGVSGTVGNIVWAMRRAFDHYKNYDSIAMSVKESLMSVKVALIWCRDNVRFKRNRYTWSTHESTLQAYKETCEFFDVTPDSTVVAEMEKLFAEHRKVMEVYDKAHSERRHEFEEKQDKKREEQLQKLSDYLNQQPAFAKATTASQRYFAANEILGTEEAREICNDCPMLITHYYSSYKTRLNLRDAHQTSLLGSRALPTPWGGTRMPDYIRVDHVNNRFITSQGVNVSITPALVALLKHIAEEIKKPSPDVQRYQGRHIGSFELREVDVVNMCMRVGCHCFDMVELESLIQDCENTPEECIKERIKILQQAINSKQATVQSLMYEIEQERKDIEKLQELLTSPSENATTEEKGE